MDHLPHIRRAIELAALARERGDEPFGALLVLDNREILCAENSVRLARDPTNHAEMNLVRKAWQELSPSVIADSILYTSTEPCPMCTGAIFWSGIRRVVFSFSAEDLGKMANDKFCGPCSVLFNRAEQKTEVIGPILAEEGRRVHEGFWSSVNR
ncbi:MAG: nucleoside deaminase [Bdellovibrionota bacterium]|nr:MAG: nucleoside deaminase [Bdellovibrionota bacterium]